VNNADQRLSHHSGSPHGVNVKFAPVTEWNIRLENGDRRWQLLMEEIEPIDLVAMVAEEVASAAQAGEIAPAFETADRHANYVRFAAVVRLKIDTFDLLMNGRSVIALSSTSIWRRASALVGR
jgi:hypothetical protein